MSAADQIVLAVVISAFPIFGLILAYESWPGRRIDRKHEPSPRDK